MESNGKAIIVTKTYFTIILFGTKVPCVLPAVVGPSVLLTIVLSRVVLPSVERLLDSVVVGLCGKVVTS